MIERTIKSRAKELADELTIEEVKQELNRLEKAKMGLSRDMFSDEYHYKMAINRQKGIQERIALLNMVERRINTIERYRKKYPTLSDDVILMLVD